MSIRLIALTTALTILACGQRSSDKEKTPSVDSSDAHNLSDTDTTPSPIPTPRPHDGCRVESTRDGGATITCFQAGEKTEVTIEGPEDHTEDCCYHHYDKKKCSHGGGY